MTGRRAYEYRHVVGFEETSLVGNVYYLNHLRWQGRCREMFLRQHCPEILLALERDLALVTLNCSCEYLAELSAFDEVIVKMYLGRIVQNRITMKFEYFHHSADGERLVARGEQRVACMRRARGKTTPIPVPDALRTALEAYSAG